MQQLPKCLLVILSHDANRTVRVEHIEHFADMILSLKNLKDLNLAKSVEQDAVSVVECVLFAFLHGDELCLCRISLRSVLSIILGKDLIEL